MADYDERYADAYLIDAVTGQRTLVAKKNRGAMTWSPSGKYLLTFDGKDWWTSSVPGGKKTNLTGSLPVKFFNEDADTPSTPGAYGTAGWTKDGKSVLLYDRYDVWRVAPDGSGAKNITAGYGRAHDLRLRYVRTEVENPRERWIDPARPLLLQAENLKTYETGFFRASLAGGAPTQLVHGSARAQRSGEGEGRRRVPADGADLQRVPRPGGDRRQFQGTAQSLRCQSAEAAICCGARRSWCGSRTPMACR